MSTTPWIAVDGKSTEWCLFPPLMLFEYTTAPYVQPEALSFSPLVAPHEPPSPHLRGIIGHYHPSKHIAFSLRKPARGHGISEQIASLTPFDVDLIWIKKQTRCSSLICSPSPYGIAVRRETPLQTRKSNHYIKELRCGSC